MSQRSFKSYAPLISAIGAKCVTDEQITALITASPPEFIRFLVDVVHNIGVIGSIAVSNNQRKLLLGSFEKDLQSLLTATKSDKSKQRVLAKNTELVRLLAKILTNQQSEKQKKKKTNFPAVFTV